ncbi:extracellular solute-binding protein [Endothiovibrio diazotrophicus]
MTRSLGYGFALLSLLFVLAVGRAVAAPALALGYEPKYPPGFDHFDYVNPDAPKGGTLTLSALGTFDSLNPFVLKGSSADGLSGLLFDTLMAQSWDEPFSLYGLLAEDVELAADGLSVTFRLNPKARFHDGSPVTAEDVKFSFDTLMSEQAHPSYRLYWEDAKGAEVIDERTVRFTFKRKNPELHLIIASGLPIFSRHWLNGRPLDEVVLEAPIGSGPYRIEKYDLGMNISFQRDPDYWARDLNVRRGQFNFDRVAFTYFKDASVQLEGLKAGVFDAVLEYHSKKWAREYVGDKFDDGRIRKVIEPHRNPQGMQGFVFNLRRPIFQDIRTRRAIALALDFEWSNEKLFFGQYTRCASYFNNSEMAATGVPEGDELALLEPFRDQLPPELFTRSRELPSTAPPGSLRKNLRKAKQLLDQAGWKLRDGVLVNEQGERLSFEVILVQKGFERIVAPFAANLKKLGVEVSYRTVDLSLYERRVESFDYDMIVSGWGVSASPGNEQFGSWHSRSADQHGSRNLVGVKSPVVDALVDKLVYAPDRKALVAAAKALDRVLLWGDYVVPQWYIPYFRIAYWDKFGLPKTLPLYYGAESWMLTTWWAKSKEDLTADEHK